MRRLIALALLLVGAEQAQASCPATLTDCPSINANNGSFGGRVLGNVAPSGTLADSRPTWGYNPVGWAIRSTSDNAATTTPGGTVIPSLAYIQQAYGGSNINDGRNGLSIFTQLTAPTSPTNPYRYYVGLSSYSTAQVSDNGTCGSPQGVLEAVTGAAALECWSDQLLCSDLREFVHQRGRRLEHDDEGGPDAGRLAGKCGPRQQRRCLDIHHLPRCRV